MYLDRWLDWFDRHSVLVERTGNCWIHFPNTMLLSDNDTVTPFNICTSQHFREVSKYNDAQ